MLAVFIHFDIGMIRAEMAIGTGLGGSAAEITAMGNQLGPITAGSLLQFGVAAQTAGVIGERSTVAKVAQPIGQCP